MRRSARSAAQRTRGSAISARSVGTAGAAAGPINPSAVAQARSTWTTSFGLAQAVVNGASAAVAPFNIPNATVRIGISDTCVTPESGRIPGSNNDFFCAQRWIDVSNDSMGVTIVCPQGALWEVGEMVDERKVNPGRGTNPELYKAWKTEAKSSSTIYLYALNNYWHTNFKADQEGPIVFDLYLKMHGPFKLEEARRFGLEMTRPLITWWK